MANIVSLPNELLLEIVATYLGFEDIKHILPSVNRLFRDVALRISEGARTGNNIELAEELFVDKPRYRQLCYCPELKDMRYVASEFPPGLIIPLDPLYKPHPKFSKLVFRPQNEPTDLHPINSPSFSVDEDVGFIIEGKFVPLINTTTATDNASSPAATYTKVTLMTIIQDGVITIPLDHRNSEKAITFLDVVRHLFVMMKKNQENVGWHGWTESSITHQKQRIFSSPDAHTQATVRNWEQTFHPYLLFSLNVGPRSR